MFNEEEILGLFGRCIHCSQIVAGAYAQRLGYDYDEVVRLAAPFGGGMFCGETCGAVAGAMLVLGMKYGYSQPDDRETDLLCREKAREFHAAFTVRHGSTVCKTLLGYDTSGPEGLRLAREEGRIAEACPRFVLDAMEILDTMMED